MPADLAALLADLDAETTALLGILDLLSDSDWQLATPAPGWSIADQVTHLAYFDDAAVTAATRPAEFAAIRTRLTDGGEDADTIAARYRHLTAAEVRAWFGHSRGGLLAAFAGLDPGARVPWFGPPMSVASSVTARLMETWAHGQDIADTISMTREPTARLRHVAHIGVAALPYSYAAHGLPAPDEPVRVELTAPTGELWAWGSEGARDRITGPALDFCLLVTQRRHRADTAMVAAGPVADQWLSIAQSFAGPPGAGRRPGQFAHYGLPMSRLPDLHRDQLTPAGKAVWDSIVATRGEHVVSAEGVLVGPFNAMVHAPDAGGPLGALGAALRFGTSLGRRLTEVAILTVASRWQAEFEWSAHARIAREAGVPDDVIDAIGAGREPAFTADDERIVHATARELIASGHLASASYAVARELLGDVGIVELVALCGYYTTISFLLNAFDVQLPAGVEPMWAAAPIDS